MNDTLSTVAEMIQEVIEDDLELDSPIVPETSFNEDLELESIEFVALAEKLQTRFGEHVDFVGWFSGKPLDEILRLTVGDLVEYIDRCRSSAPTD